MSKTATPSGGRRNLAAFLRFKGRVEELAAKVGWGVSILGVLLPWSVMDIVLQNMGATTPIRQPRTPQHYVPSPGQMAVPIAAPA